MEAFRVASARENSEPKQQHTPGVTAEVSDTIMGLKDAGVMIPNTSPFNSPMWPVRR